MVNQIFLFLQGKTMSTKFSELVASWRLAFCPMTKENTEENHDTTFVFKSLY